MEILASCVTFLPVSLAKMLHKIERPTNSTFKTQQALLSLKLTALHTAQVNAIQRSQIAIHIIGQLNWRLVC